MTPIEQFFYYIGFASTVFVVGFMAGFVIGELIYWEKTRKTINKAVKGEIRPKVTHE